MAILLRHWRNYSKISLLGIRLTFNTQLHLLFLPYLGGQVANFRWVVGKALFFQKVLISLVYADPVPSVTRNLTGPGC